MQPPTWHSFCDEAWEGLAMLLLPKPGNAKGLKNTTTTIFYVALKAPGKSTTFLLPTHPKGKRGLQCIARQSTDHVRTIASTVTMQGSFYIFLARFC